MDDEIEIPQYFICPISLQIMTDPVTVTTGITYDRQSIEHWLLTAEDVATCPVTKQPLPRDSDLTQNHTLRRLIQAWCTANDIARIPTPRPTPSISLVLKLHRDLKVPERYVCNGVKSGHYTKNQFWCTIVLNSPLKLFVRNFYCDHVTIRDNQNDQ